MYQSEMHSHYIYNKTLLIHVISSQIWIVKNHIVNSFDTSSLKQYPPLPLGEDQHEVECPHFGECCTTPISREADFGQRSTSLMLEFCLGITVKGAFIHESITGYCNLFLSPREIDMSSESGKGYFNFNSFEPTQLLYAVETHVKLFLSFAETM